jgi:hypothetical protein
VTRVRPRNRSYISKKIIYLSLRQIGSVGCTEGFPHLCNGQEVKQLAHLSNTNSRNVCVDVHWQLKVDIFVLDVKTGIPLPMYNPTDKLTSVITVGWISKVVNTSVSDLLTQGSLLCVCGIIVQRVNVEASMLFWTNGDISSNIWGFHSCEIDKCCLLGCDAVWLMREPMFGWNVSHPSSRRKEWAT